MYWSKKYKAMLKEKGIVKKPGLQAKMPKKIEGKVWGLLTSKRI